MKKDNTNLNSNGNFLWKLIQYHLKSYGYDLEENKHETYGDSQWKHVVVVDLEHGFVEYYSELGL